QRVEHLTERVVQNFKLLSDRIDTTTGRIVESEMRVATASVDLAGTVNDIKTILIDRLGRR
ncbi:MAG TPA: hypothetical protein VMZ53_33440, partial [Kofleriaceae bacterium]|nr:hypothetical protein [Kofleriaceae bacterium]